MRAQMCIRLSYLILCLLAFIPNISSFPIRHRVHRLRYVKRNEGHEMPFFYPGAVAKEKNRSGANSFIIPTDLDLALDVLRSEFGIKSSDVELTHSYIDDANINHLFFIRIIKKIRVANQDCSVHVRNLTVIYVTSTFSFKSPQKRTTGDVASTNVDVPLEQAALIAEKHYSAKRNKANATLGYLVLPDSEIIYAHTFQIQNSSTSLWLQVSVDAHTGQIVQVIDFIQKASYKAIVLPKFSPPDSFIQLNNPAQSGPSPYGWNSDGYTNFYDTQGNNCDVSIDSTSRPSGGSTLTFQSNWDGSLDPTARVNMDASSIHLFYLVNFVHDIFWQFGFTPQAGNFQSNNFGRGGLGDDRIIVNNQNSQGTNNANFATPPDGQSGVMNMYLFTITSPYRDGSLDSMIPIHELTHGLSNRLTGGPSNSACLQATESAGMGEGWSDAVALYLTRKSSDSPTNNVGIGIYVVNNARGVRRYPYSTSMTTNPLKYSNLQTDTEVHRIGEIWCEMLFEMYWNLVRRLGFTSNWNNAKQLKGNIVALRVIIGGMMLQPCNPTFMQARDAILQAEKQYYSGAYACPIWKAFAKRGLGVNAISSTYTDGFAVPAGC